ncbi:unnamed protein product [Allacma fusca]|uniref:Choline transporter-like protein n=1 Tax=Allacma fusca TaxID=39272 RepID=A0A8J2J6S5_9HEXA|nr:unnamed protein product [Allacma fusca]
MAIKPIIPGGAIVAQRHQIIANKHYYMAASSGEPFSTSFAYASREELEESGRMCGRRRESDHIPALRGPLEKKRKCRDVICLVFFGIFLIFMGVVAGYVFVHGRFSRLNVDNWGKCGDGPDLQLQQLKPSPLTTNRQTDAIQMSIKMTTAPGSKDSNPTDFFSDAALKFSVSWPNIVYMCLIALGLSLVMTGMLRAFSGIIIWIIIAVVITAGVAGSCFFWIVYTGFGGPDVEISWHDHKGLALLGAVIFSTITAALFLVTLAMKKRIALVVRLFKEAGKAVHAVPSVLIQPAWTVLCQIVVIYIFAILALLIETIQFEDDRNECQKPTSVTYFRFLNLFAFLWMSQFLVACQHVVVAGAISRWFFTRNKKQLGSPLLISFQNLVRYHLGSVAFGSLIVALVKFIRYLVNAIKNRLPNGGGKIGALFVACCNCFLWCLDKFIKYLSRNAYIEIAIYGYGFCPAAKRAFNIITSNALRLATINSIGDFVLFLAKITIVALTTLCGYYIFQANLSEGETLEGEWGLIGIGAVLAYFISHCFISIYEMTVDTIFICFCEDTKMNDGDLKPYFMSKGLMEFIKASKHEKY